MDVAHTFTPSPDGNYAVTETEYQYTPLRIWDSEPRTVGQAQNIDTPISAWTADWRDLSHNHEVRWPFVFVSAYEDGLQIFNLKDPKHPRPKATTSRASASTSTASAARRTTGGRARPASMQGAFGVDVRNHDGLIVISDMRTGLWLFKMDGFNGWNGNDFGMPNISSVQDYDHGPVHSADFVQSDARRSRAGEHLCSAGASPRLPCAAGPFDIPLFSTPKAPDAHGHARLVFSASPFGVGVTRRRPCAATTSRSRRTACPAPTSLGPYAAYVAWATTHRPVAVGPAGADEERAATSSARSSFNKFLLVVAAESSATSRRTPDRRCCTARRRVVGLQSFLSHPLFRGIPP